MPKITGTNYEVEDGAINLFGTRGRVLSRHKWLVDSFEVKSGTIVPEIRACIKQDIKAGNGGKLAQLQLGYRSAMTFFLGGGLQPMHFRKVVETANRIDIPNVEIEGYTLTVRILGDVKVRIATADSKGKVL